MQQLITTGPDNVKNVERIVAIIPARMASTRFPGKPLAKLHGIPMVEHVFRRAKSCSELTDVYVATCDEKIREVAEGFGAKVIITSAKHERATDRVAEAAEHCTADVVVMIQGDEPMITPEMIRTSIEPLRANPSCSCVNLVHRITTRQEFNDPNTIKVVGDIHGNALYFSRAPIPHLGEHATPKLLKQVCVIAFTRQCLRDFASFPSTPLERAESIDMLRLLEHGGRVRLVETPTVTHSVDTPADLRLVETMMEDDQLMRQYL